MSIWLEFDALDSGARLSRRDLEFLMELRETPLPVSVVVEEALLPPATRSLERENAGSARLVDGDRVSHFLPEFQQTSRELGSDHAAMRVLAQGSQGDPSTTTARSLEAYISKTGGDMSHSQCLQFLRTKGPGLMIKNLEDKEKVCSLLLNVADIVKVLPPGDEPLAGDILDMSLWRSSLRALVQEMKTVEEIFPSLIGSSSVYVLTASPYPAFLRALAAEIADRCS